jgi:hypothetical protein
MRKIFLSILIIVSSIPIFSQSEGKPQGRLSGNFNMEAWFYLKDSVIGTEVPPEKTL